MTVEDSRRNKLYHAFRPGASIIGNAKTHYRRQCVLNLDLMGDPLLLCVRRVLLDEVDAWRSDQADTPTRARPVWLLLAKVSPKSRIRSVRGASPR